MKKSAPAIKTLVFALMASLSATAFSAAPLPERPVLALPVAGMIDRQCTNTINELSQMVVDLERIPAETEEGAEAFLKGWNLLQIKIEDMQGPMSLFAQVSPDPDVREKADLCASDMQDFVTELYQNAKLYRNMRIMRVNDDEERKLRQDNVSVYEDTGVTLAGDRKARVKFIMSRLTEISQQFSKNIRENKTRLVFAPEELQGLPEDYIKNLEQDAQGNYLLGFSYPEYMPFMQYADNDKAREEYRFAFINRGGEKNLKLLQEAVTLRREMAVISGYRSYADFALRRRMAKKPIAVERFLDDIEQIAAQAEKREMDELRAYKASVRNIPLEQAEIKHWDTNYWLQKVKKERYSIDPNTLRQYFQTDAAMKWAMGIASELYDLTFRRAAIQTWHDDVQYYDVMDAKTGRQIGGVYLDIFPREGKYGHAAAFPVQGSSTMESRLPISVLVTNFNRDGLDLNELETLLHEFGHVLHGVLSKTRFVEQSGTSVERDFVEAPSQMFEEWAHSYETLSALPAYCSRSCPQVDPDMLRRLNESRKFGRGIFYSRQVLYGKYDMKIHSGNPGNVMSSWIEMEGKTLQGYDEGTQFPGQFSHLTGGYAAGYYGYLWSKVLAQDMFSRFNNKLLNPEVGHQYKKAILERGSELPADRMVHFFLGRPPESTAFYEDLAGLTPEQVITVTSVKKANTRTGQKTGQKKGTAPKKKKQQ